MVKKAKEARTMKKRTVKKKRENRKKKRIQAAKAAAMKTVRKEYAQKYPREWAQRAQRKKES